MRYRTIRPPKHRRIAPRLASGESRIPAGNGLPPAVKYAIQRIAAQEGRSFSWVVEEILIDWARHDSRLSNSLKAEAITYQPRKADIEREQKEHEEDVRLKTEQRAARRAS